MTTDPALVAYWTVDHPPLRDVADRRATRVSRCAPTDAHGCVEWYPFHRPTTADATRDPVDSALD